uniref:Uncharacterized protein n=1 Tax=Arion vulgaris TaxID=1028688 RepID=A0A0B7BCS5_9EUPU
MKCVGYSTDSGINQGPDTENTGVRTFDLSSWHCSYQLHLGRSKVFGAPRE